MAIIKSDFVKFFLILPLAVIILAAGTSYAIFTYMGPPSMNEDEGEPNEMGPTLPLGDFVVNLRGEGGYRYIQTSIVVEASNDRILEELDRREPLVRDTIINILSQKRLSDIEENGKDIIKNQIRVGLNEILHGGEIESVLFTQFVVQ